MMLPLAVLVLGAIFAGYLNWPKHSLGSFLGQSPSFHRSYQKASAIYGAEKINPDMFGVHREKTYKGLPHATIMAISALVAILGILLAYLMHLKDRQRCEQLASRHPRLTRLLEAKYWVDEVYQNGIVEPLRKGGRVLFNIDRFVIDTLVFAVGFAPQVLGFVIKLTTQRGSLQGYALTMLLFIAIILLVLLT